MAEPMNAAASSTSAPAGDGMMTDDQRFLLTIILGVYFGPHLKGETPAHKSVMQRVNERLPPCTPNQLAGSKIMMAQLMHVYYHILRKASNSVVLPPSLLLNFLRDTLPAKVLGPVGNCPRFISFFPIDLHPFSYVGERFMAIGNVVFIANPNTSYLRKEVVARFKSLTGLQEFTLDKNATELPIYITDEAFYEVIGLKAGSEGQSHSFEPPHGSQRRKRKSDEALNVTPLRMGPYECSPILTSSFSSGERLTTNFKAQLDSKVVFSPLNMEEMHCRGATAAWIAGAGSFTGCVSLAESEDCYLFQVSLPLVRRDQTFSFELDMSGKVLIEGETAAGGKVEESRTGYLSRHFSLGFQLPGRVDPRRSNCNFGSDGIFTGIVKKLNGNQC